MNPLHHPWNTPQDHSASLRGLASLCRGSFSSNDPLAVHYPLHITFVITCLTSAVSAALLRHSHLFYTINATNNLDAKPETSGTNTQKCLCWRFKEIYVAYFGPYEESGGVCVSSVTLNACSSRPLLCPNKLTPQPNLRQLIMLAYIYTCVSVSKGLCWFLWCFITHPSNGETRVSVALNCKLSGTCLWQFLTLLFVYWRKLQPISSTLTLVDTVF